MKEQTTRTIRSFLHSEDGQALPWMVFLIILFLGMAGLTLDLGRAYVSYRELQASTDAAALAAAMELANPGSTKDTVIARGMAYSAQAGYSNASYNLTGALAKVIPYCSSLMTGQGVACGSTTAGNYNAVSVTQTVSITPFFIQALRTFGLDTATGLNMSSRGSAGMHGGGNDQYNIAILIDTTPSMADRDYTCPGYSTKIACALGGVQTLLKDISPCTAATSSAKATCDRWDSVSLFTFPAVKANTASADTDCKSSTTPTYVSYPTPAPGAVWSAPTGSNGTYQITDFLSDFSSTNSAGGDLSTTSLLSKAAGVGNCGGLQTGSSVKTYFAGAIYAAQSSLVAAQKLNSETKNAMIILTDGDANNATIATSGTIHKAGSTSNATNSDNSTTKFNYTVQYPNSGSNANNCWQAIDAANNAKAQGTEVYTVAYASSGGGCQTDTSLPKGTAKPSACDTVKWMATDADHFYSDDAGSGGSCSSSKNGSLTTLAQIFGNIANHTKYARLIPNEAVTP